MWTMICIGQLLVTRCNHASCPTSLVDNLPGPPPWLHGVNPLTSETLKKASLVTSFGRQPSLQILHVGGRACTNLRFGSHDHYGSPQSLFNLTTKAITSCTWSSIRLLLTRAQFFQQVATISGMRENLAMSEPISYHLTTASTDQSLWDTSSQHLIHRTPRSLNQNCCSLPIFQVSF